MNSEQAIKELSDVELRIKVAELRGWTDLETTPEGIPSVYPNPEVIGFRLDLFHRDGRSRDWWPVPDYPNDLNAMHEAEMSMTDEQYSRYGWYLLESSVGHVLECKAYLGATARRRAEAFVITMEELKQEIENG